MPNDWLGMETFLPHRFPFIEVIFENLHRREKWGASGIYALIKNKIKFSSFIRRFRMEQLQSHI
jgi:hypothetical protein